MERPALRLVVPIAKPVDTRKEVWVKVSWRVESWEVEISAEGSRQESGKSTHSMLQDALSSCSADGTVASCDNVLACAKEDALEQGAAQFKTTEGT